MATQVLKDASFTFNAVDLSDHVRSVTHPYGGEAQDDTAMGDNTRSVQGGLKTWSMEVLFFADEAASNVNATLFPDVQGTARTVLLRPTSAAVSSTNPNYTGSAMLDSIEPVSGEVGQMQMLRAVFLAAGDLSRATS